MSPIPLVELNNGTKIPIIGIGGGPSSMTAEACEAAKAWISTAIQASHTQLLALWTRLIVAKAGYRHIDTALIYGTEKVIGEAIRESGVPREEFFITTKLPFNCQDRVAESFDLSLKNLGVDYVDLGWLDLPRGPDGSVLTVDSPTFNDSYAQIEKIYASGRAKAIGVSNFSIKTRHPYLAQNQLIAYHKQKGQSSAIREDPVIAAIAAKHSVSPTQVILAWHTARGVIVIPKSENEQRQKDNMAVSTRGFLGPDSDCPFLQLPVLDEEDLKKIDGLDRGERLYKADENGKMWGWTMERLGW
ncbi:reductase AKOR2 [Armillaria mellea]|nr:reductase AKOR2 [Armillaria mellea]